MGDGKFIPEGLVEVSKMATEDEQTVNLVTEIADECNNVTDADRYTLYSRFCCFKCSN